MLCVLRRCPAASARPTLRRNKDARSRPEGKHETNQAAGRRLAVCRHARDANAGGLPGDFFAAAEGWTSISQEVGREIPGDARLCLPVQSAADGAALPRPGACLGGRPADRSRISLPAFGIAAAGRRTRTRRADLAPAFERYGLQSPALGMSSD